MPKLLRSPLAWIAFGVVGTLAPMVALPSGAGWPISLLALTLFSVAGPLACALSDSWWIYTFLTGVAWVVTFVAVGETPGLNALRELATVYMLPMMVYRIAGPISAMIRASRRKGRVQPPPVHIST